MKTLKVTIAALFISALSFAQAPTTQEAKALVTNQSAPATISSMKWVSETHDFGDIEKGKPVTYEFTFTNTSKETVLLTNVKPSCGCTAANYTKTPIKPGEKGTVEAMDKFILLCICTKALFDNDNFSFQYTEFEPLQFNDVRTLECIIELDPGQPLLRIGQRVRVQLVPTEDLTKPATAKSK